MLWVLKRTAQKNMFNLMGKEINAILGAQIILIWTYVIVLFSCYSCGKYIRYLFVCFDSLHPGQQVLSHVGTDIPG